MPPSVRPYGNYCLTTDNECTDYAGVKNTHDNSALMTERRTIGTPPKQPSVRWIVMDGVSYYGIHLDNYHNRILDGQPWNYLLLYFL